MEGESKFYSFVNFLAWLIPGASFIVAVYASITNSEFRPQLASDGSKILIVTWVVTWLAFKFFEMRPSRNSVIKSPGRKIHAFFFGAILALWAPRLLQPLTAQKVEIVLDVSQRMGQEFNPRGTTKFDAAREGVLRVLGYLENQNVEVALRLVNSTEIGQCKIEPESSLVVDFTRDLDEIRHHLDTISISPSSHAPVVDAIDFSIDHYQNSKRFDKKLYIYSFLGGVDTCGEEMGVYFDSPKVKENAIEAKLFLIILLGTNEETVIKNLPNVKLDFARDASQVQDIVSSNNRSIAISTPTATLPPSPTGSPDNPGPSPTRSSIATPEPSVSNNDQPEPITAATQPREHNAPATQPPSNTPSATVAPSRTNTVTMTPSRTPTFTFTLSRTPTQTSLSTLTPNMSPSDTSTSFPPTPTPTLEPLAITIFALQSDVFSPDCPLLTDVIEYAQFHQSQANIVATLEPDGFTSQQLRLTFSNVREEQWSYAGWQVRLGASDQTGIDLSGYTYLVFRIRGAVGGEEPNIWLTMPDAVGARRYWKDVEQVTPVTTEWQQVIIPLSYFTSSSNAAEQVDLTNIKKIEIIFEWYPQPTSGTIFIDDLCVVQ